MQTAVGYDCAREGAQARGASASRRTPGGGIIPESPGGFAGIRIDVAIERLDERDALT